MELCTTALTRTLRFLQVILKQLDLIEDQTTVKALHKKMAPPLVTLLSAESEIQYVALRNINLIVQKNPGILAHEVKVCLNLTIKTQQFCNDAGGTVYVTGFVIALNLKLTV